MINLEEERKLLERETSAWKRRSRDFDNLLSSLLSPSDLSRDMPQIKITNWVEMESELAHIWEETAKWNVTGLSQTIISERDESN